jgi:hypothetical protein
LLPFGTARLALLGSRRPVIQAAQDTAGVCPRQPSTCPF